MAQGGSRTLNNANNIMNRFGKGAILAELRVMQPPSLQNCRLSGQTGASAPLHRSGPAQERRSLGTKITGGPGQTAESQLTDGH